MEWTDIITNSILGATFWAVANWFSNKNIQSSIKEFIKMFILLFIIYVIIPYLPDFTENVKGIGFATPIIVITLVLLFRGLKKG